MTYDSPLPPLNHDCVSLILSESDTSALISLAATSRAFNACVQPILVRSARLRTSNSSQIAAFCNIVTTRRLASAVHNLDIIHDADNNNLDSSFHVVLPILSQVLEDATYLASLSIPVRADDLLNLCPTFAARAPSSRLELGGIDDSRSSWLTSHPLKGLHTLHLNFTSFAQDILKVAAPSTHSLTRLSLVGYYEKYLQIGAPELTEEQSLSFEQIHFLSLSNVGTSISTIAHYFPNVHLIDTWSTSFHPLTNSDRDVELSELVAVSGPIYNVLQLLTQPAVRLVCLTQFFQQDSFASFTNLLRGTKLRSLSLVSGLVPLTEFWNKIVEAAPLLSYVEIDIERWFLNRAFTDLPEAIEWETCSTIARVACDHLRKLEDLSFLVLRFPSTSETDAETSTTVAHLQAHFGGLAAQCLELLPHAKYILIDLDPFKQCVARGGQVIEEDEAERLRSWYQWEGVDARLAGAQEWLQHVENI